MRLCLKVSRIKYKRITKDFKKCNEVYRAKFESKLAKNNEEFKAEFNKLKRSIEESRAEVKVCKEQLTTKLEEPNTRLEGLETRVQQSLNVFI